MHGRLNFLNYTATASTASQLQRSVAAYSIIPSRQPTKYPLTLESRSTAELIAGAQSFFGIGALRVDPLPFCPADDYPAL